MEPRRNRPARACTWFSSRKKVIRKPKTIARMRTKMRTVPRLSRPRSSLPISVAPLLLTDRGSRGNDRIEEPGDRIGDEVRRRPIEEADVEDGLSDVESGLDDAVLHHGLHRTAEGGDPAQPAHRGLG